MSRGRAGFVGQPDSVWFLKSDNGEWRVYHDLLSAKRVRSSERNSYRGKSVIIEGRISELVEVEDATEH